MSASFDQELADRLNELGVPQDLILKDVNIAWRILERGYLLYVRDITPGQIDVHILEPPTLN